MWMLAFFSPRPGPLVIDLLTVTESRHTATVASKIRTEFQSVNDIYLLSTFRLPPKQGGVLFGLYYKKDNSRWFEASVVGKTNKGEGAGRVPSRGLNQGFARLKPTNVCGKRSGSAHNGWTH